MNKIIKYAIAIFASLLLFSCGEKRNSGETSEIVMTPSEVEVSGDLEGCFVVKERKYKATGDWANGIITVEIERTDNDLPFELGDRELCSFSTYMYDANVQVGFGIEFLDEDGNVLDKVSADGSGTSGSYDTDEAVALCKLKKGRKGTIRFTVDDSAKEAVSFRISSAYKENAEREYTGSSNDEDTDDGIDQDADDEADEEDALISSSKIGPEEAIAAFASFVSMMEGVKTLTDSKAEAIDNEFKRLENLYGKLKENDFSVEQQKRIRELRRKAEKERERLTKSYNPFSDGEDSDDDDDDF